MSTDAVREGARAQMFSTTRPFSPDEWERVNAWLDRIYADFTGKVADGRRLTTEQVHQVARGRVWTGADAAANGLVDQLGGLDVAERIARRRGGLPEDAPVRPYPRVNPLDRLRAPAVERGPRGRGGTARHAACSRAAAGGKLRTGRAVRGPARPAGRRPAAAAGQLDDQLTCLRPRGARRLPAQRAGFAGERGAVTAGEHDRRTAHAR